MQDHPQVRAFTEAALSLRAERYWHYGSTDERVEFLRALGDVLTEVSYHLDANAVRKLPLPPSTGSVLMSYLDRRIERLIAAQCDSGNTGAEGGRSA